jgi:hypothetical protein
VSNIDFEYDGLKNTEMQKCMKETLLKSKFPAPQTGSTYGIKGYPFIFTKDP